MKELLLGSEKTPEPKKQTIHEVAKEVVSTNLLKSFVENYKLLNIETKKQIVIIFINLLKVVLDDKYIIEEYIENHSEILTLLVQGFVLQMYSFFKIDMKPQKQLL